MRKKSTLLPLFFCKNTTKPNSRVNPTYTNPVFVLFLRKFKHIVPTAVFQKFNYTLLVKVHHKYIHTELGSAIHKLILALPTEVFQKFLHTEPAWVFKKFKQITGENYPNWALN